MLAFLARSTTFAIALLAARGCIGPDGQQLLTEDGSSSAPWTECSDELLVRGRHGDRCTFPEGSSCALRDFEAEGRPWTTNTCLEGRLVRSTNTTIAEAYPEGRCEAPNVTDWVGFTFDIQPGTGGCLDAAICDDGSQQVICQAPGGGGVRAGAEGVAPWTECDEALQGAADRDPCVGSFVCGGERELAPGAHSVTIGASCDEGVLRLYTLNTLHG